MNRTNLILLVILAAFVAIWASKREWSDQSTTRRAPRMFPEFNKEAADRIEISGGWSGDTVVIARSDSGPGWVLASAGAFPVRKENVTDFIDAVWNLRRENFVGSSEASRADTLTDDKDGRLVRVLKGDKAMAEFRVGKNPRGYESEFVFIRPEGEDNVYRTRTILSREENRDVEPGGMGPRGYEWRQNVFGVGQNWTESRLWDPGKLETQELWLTRSDLEAKFVKKGQDVWEVVSGEKTHSGDVDAINGLTGGLKYLRHSGVAGRYDEVAQEYGLDAPEATLVMTFREKLEKKEEKKEGEDAKEGEDETKEGEGEGEGEDGKSEEEKEEYRIVKRTLEVGKKLSRPSRRDDKTGEVETEDVYPIRINGDFDDPAQQKLTDYVFFVSTYPIDPLRKSLDDFIQKPEEGAGDGAADTGDGDEKKGDADDGEGKGDGGDGAAKDDAADDGAGDEGAKKEDAPTEPKKTDEPTEPKKADEPAEPKKTDEPAEPKKTDEPAEPKKSDG